MRDWLRRRAVWGYIVTGWMRLYMIGAPKLTKSQGGSGLSFAFFPLSSVQGLQRAESGADAAGNGMAMSAYS
jgi:hypothetical protein